MGESNAHSAIPEYCKHCHFSLLTIDCLREYQRCKIYMNTNIYGICIYKRICLSICLSLINKTTLIKKNTKKYTENIPNNTNRKISKYPNNLNVSPNISKIRHDIPKRWKNLLEAQKLPTYKLKHQKKTSKCQY